MTKKVLVLGVTGLVGGRLWEEFLGKEGYEVHGTYHNLYGSGQHLWECDITNVESVRGIVEKVRPDVIINATAYASVDKCETNKDECIAVNIQGLVNLINVAPNSYIVHFSTDYIFDGTRDDYFEFSLPNPLNFYGLSKLCGEMFLDWYVSSLVIRTTGVFGWELQKKNFVYKVLNTIGKGQELKVPVDQIGCPTYAPNLAAVVKNLVEKDIGGIVNVNGTTRLNRVEFATEICDVFGLDGSLIKPVITAELGQLARRPLKGGLNTDYVQNWYPEVKLLTAREGLEEMKEELMRRGEYAIKETS